MSRIGTIGRHAVQPTDQGEDWRNRSACRDYDPELWFPVSETENAAAVAIEVCHRCHVEERCLIWAMQTGQDSGVWGGMTSKQRREHRIDNGHVVPGPPPPRPCQHCAGPLPGGVTSATQYCSGQCRQLAYQARKASAGERNERGSN